MPSPKSYTVLAIDHLYNQLDIECFESLEVARQFANNFHYHGANRETVLLTGNFDIHKDRLSKDYDTTSSH